MPLSISLIFCGIVFFTLDDYGITWDEGVHFLAGEKYLDWLKHPSIKTIDQYWGFKATSTQHPPLVFLLGGITKYVFHEKLNWLNGISSFRISVLLFVFALSFALFSFVSRLYGNQIAFIVSLTYFFLPRIFFHSHLAALDYPATAMWFLTVYAYWKGVKNQRWIIYASILLGFALLTKLNSYLIFIPLLFYWLLFYNRRLQCLVVRKGHLSLRKYIHMFSKIIPLLIIPLIIFVTFWPYLWKNPITRILEYPFLTLKLTQVKYTYYFGKVLTHVPWHYPFVMTFITVPLVVLVPFFMGLFTAYKKPYRKVNIFILFNSLLPLFAVSLPMVSKYDGVRLFLPAFPFICIISGLGVKHIFDLAKKFRMGKAAFLVYILLFFLSFYHPVIKDHPYQSSYFNEVIGGVDGAAGEGFDVEYWGNAYIGTLSFLNEHSDSTFWVYHHPARYRFYDREGLLKKNIKFGDRNNSDYLVLMIRPGSFNQEMWDYFKHEKPVFSVCVSKTALINIYKLK